MDRCKSVDGEEEAVSGPLAGCPTAGPSVSNEESMANSKNLKSEISKSPIGNVVGASQPNSTSPRVEVVCNLEDDQKNEFRFTPLAEKVAQQAINASARGDHVDSEGEDGVRYLMNSCTHMLKSRMGVPATPPSVGGMKHMGQAEIALDTVGPILETVLSNLTGEYEKRLFAKDEEHKLQAETIAVLRKQAVELKKQLEEVKASKSRDEIMYEERKVDNSLVRHMEASMQEKEEEIRNMKERMEIYEKRLNEKAREIEHLKGAMQQESTEMEQRLAAAEKEISTLEGIRVKYKKSQKENRELYNIVQDLRGNIRVYCRVRPCGVGAADDSPSVIQTDEEEGRLAAYSSKHGKWNEFQFDRVFGEESNQEHIYMETKPLIRSVLDGYKVCIFAYGQTGSGKTHTMTGEVADPGINPRALEDLFELKRERSNEEDYSFRVQLLEIYNENVRDLLSDNQDALKIVATRGSGSNVPGATQIGVSSASDVFRILEKGSKNRAVGQTNMNERSSRSHQVLTIMVEGRNLINSSTSYGCLHLIDLAGSERINKSGVQGQRLTEAQHINKSLTALGCVMQALGQKRDYIPFRDSKLTQLLQDSLSGEAKSMMFVHVSPEETSIGETLSTLNFGKGVTEITLGEAKRHTDSGSNIVLREKLASAEKEIKTLSDKIGLLERKESTPVGDVIKARRMSSTQDKKKLNGIQLQLHPLQSRNTDASTDKLEGRVPPLQLGAINTGQRTPLESKLPGPGSRRGSQTSREMASSSKNQASSEVHARTDRRGSVTSSRPQRWM